MAFFRCVVISQKLEGFSGAPRFRASVAFQVLNNNRFIKQLLFSTGG